MRWESHAKADLENSIERFGRIEASLSKHLQTAKRHPPPVDG